MSVLIAALDYGSGCAVCNIRSGLKISEAARFTG